ncbi:S-adenosylmethionine decarboxylase family protein [Veillonella criceti]|uniref:S-adenosylmethionine decarboxylase proenzyme n=1 Tax=Veillonella criceti TaxID=103891 RepID=A0A380NIW0_9FIRM|nr:S-adenosylmethionine decarboxylase [Veillonella criceti]SUP40806.1 S-adenosylmethionine decarboxylase proenzyme precursor [Veillonella criceti]
MANSVGTHLLIDLYTCLEDVMDSPLIIQESVTNALEAAQQPIDEISCQVLDDEVVLFAVSPHCHIAVHAYPDMGYVAVDIYTFNNPLQATLIMRVLKQSFGAERVKATSINRGDFGSIRDMKPRKKTSLSALARVTRTRMRLQQTGTKLKSTGAKVFKVISKKNRHQQPLD